MLVRIVPFRAALHLQRPAYAASPPSAAASSSGPVSASDRTRVGRPRLFHVTASRRDELESRNHYETLHLQTDATQKDIKTSFYTLSKHHHPDHNPSDPNAPRRFMRISEAYSVLSCPDKREKYDRDVLRLHAQSSFTHQPHHRGSYSSTGPLGARPASGLSRRRTTFRGPPPSFYRSGGWGAHEEKRRGAHEQSTSSGATAEANREKDPSTSGYASYNTGGMGPGQEPFGRGSAGDMPHFDQAAKMAHTRSQAKVDEIRARKLARDFRVPGSTDYSELGSFFAILAVLGAAVGLPYLVMRGWGSGGKKKATRTS